MRHCVALIVAAGSGQRYGSDVPKQFHELGGSPILRRTVQAFLHHPRVDGVLVVINPTHRGLYDAATTDLALLPPVAGGATRQESVRLGLEALSERPPDLVLIHDAARPLIDAATIDAVCEALAERPAAIAAVPVTDTLKRASGATVAETVERRDLWRAQTPQGFHFAAILEAHRAAAGLALTDDAAVAEHAGLPVALVAARPENLKVTTEADLRRAERLLRGPRDEPTPETRIGSGFDVHRFGPGDGVVLCGVRVPHDQSLVGHSDADAGLHALTDALLGAIGAGDIGQHFPPSDARWRGADSGQFLRHAADLVARRGGRVVNVDVTLLCEAPKIGPHRAAMAARIAELLGLSVERIGVKATTTEGLGFTGRREGIAALATATVQV